MGPCFTVRHWSVTFWLKNFGMEARLTHVFNGIVRSMAPAGPKKALSFEAVRLASR